jgi:hypothetical protein
MPLTNFFGFVSDFKSVAALMGKAALLAPFVGLLLNISPPWPTGTGVSALTALAEVLVLIYIFQFFMPLSKRRLENRLRVFFLIVVGWFAVYISVYSVFVYDIPLTKSHDVKGFILRPGIQAILGPGHSIDRVLEGAEWDAFEVWEGWSIHAVRVSLLLSWILFFVGIAACIAIFVVLQQKVSPEKIRTAAPSKAIGSE